MALKIRRVDAPLVLAAFAVSFGVTLTAAILVTTHHGGARELDPPPGPVSVRAGAAGYLTPDALDRQWIAYSDHSTCADRAGGDGVSAVRLSSSQVAWFFSDTSLGPAGPSIGLSRQSGFVHNLVVMQTVHGSRSKLVTVTGGDGCPGPGRPGHTRSLVSPRNAGGQENQRYWAADGMRIGSRVVRFYNRYLPGSLSAVGTVIASFGVRQLASVANGPAFGAVIRPDITRLPTYVPQGGGTLIVWGTALLRQGGTIYVYGWQSPGPGLALNCYLARVPVSRLTDMRAWRFYSGGGRWAPSQADAQPIPSGLSIDTGFSVIRQAGRYWLIEQAGGLGSPYIGAYPARTPWGPFDDRAAILLYRAEGIGLTAADHFQIMYQAQAEPALSTKRTLVISYNVNSLAVTAGCLPLSDFTNAAIQPRFIAVPRSAFSTYQRSAGPIAAAAGPASYRPSAGQHDPRWFDSWDYHGGCPPLHAVRHVSVTHADGRTAVHWQALGPGVRYQIYLRGPGGRYVLVRTATRASVIFSNLKPGSRYEVLIVPVNRRQWTGHGRRVVITAATSR